MEVDQLRREITSLRDRLFKLSEATLRIGEDLDSDAILDHVIEAARSLTQARYGVLLTYDDAGAVASVSASGLTREEIEQVSSPPSGLGLLGHLNEVSEPVRIADISRHPSSVGFPDNHPPMKTFLGVQIRNRREHVGNIFLTEKHGGEEFTLEDEETLVIFASFAAQAISNVRRYREVHLAKTDMETLIDISPMGVGVYDAKSGFMVSYNQEMRRIVGNVELTLNGDEPLVNVLTFRRPDGRAIPLYETPVARVMMSGETIRAEEIVVEFPDGGTISTLVNAAPIFAETGEIASVVVAVQDLAPLEDLERVRAEFLGLVSQELRSPLATIKGSANALEGILDTTGHSESQHLLRIIDQQTELMRSQINSLVELTQIEAGTLSISAKTTTVSDLVSMASEEFQRVHPGTIVDAEISSELPPVMADGERISRVLQNLFSEASRISRTASRVQVSATQLDIYVAFSVSSDSDAFPGEEFVGRSILPGKGAAGPTTQGAARDLAYAFNKRIVEAHGGRIRAQRGERGIGMIYTFTLPATDEPLEPAAARTAGAASQASRNGSAPEGTQRILVAVSDGRVLGAVRRALDDANYSTIAATDPADIDRIVSEEKPNLLLYDLSHHGGDGFDSMQRLSGHYDIPIIVLSSPGDDANIGRAFDAGADDYIEKPFSPTELVARIKSTLRKQTAHVRGAAVSNGYAKDGVSVDYDARTLTVSGAQVPLTATEYKLLYELSRNAGRILTQDELLHRVWGSEYIGEPRLLRSYVKSLRQKLGDSARSPSYIFTEHGIGYRMASQ